MREWLNAQAAGGYVDVRPRQRPLHAAARAGGRARPTRTARRSCPALFQIALGAVPRRRRGSPRPPGPATGVGWHEHDHDVSEGCERFFRPGYHAHLVAEWLPALDGVVEKLERGRPRRRRRLRSRRLDDPHGAGVPDVDVRRLRLPRGARSRRARTARSEAGVADRVRVRGRRAPTATSRAPTTTSSRCSTACTTWATRSAPRATSATPSPPTARG